MPMGYYDFYDDCFSEIARRLTCTIPLFNQYLIVAYTYAMNSILAPPTRINVSPDENSEKCYSYILDKNKTEREDTLLCKPDLSHTQKQLERDWADLEEDDEYIFYPIALYDQDNTEYQSFTMYQRVVGERTDRADPASNIPEIDIDTVFWPVETNYTSGMGFQTFTMYKKVDKKIRPVSTTFSPEYEVKRSIPNDPMLTLPKLTAHPPIFSPTARLDSERLKILEINKDGFLSPEEEKLFI
jgi:hypothetical protein